MVVANVLLFMKKKQSPVLWNGWECFPKICCHKCNQVVTVCFPIFVLMLRHGLWTLCNFIFVIVAMTVGVQAGTLVVALGSSCLVAFRSRRSKCYITTWFTCAQRMRRNKKLETSQANLSGRKLLWFTELIATVLFSNQRELFPKFFVVLSTSTNYLLCIDFHNL